MDVLIDYDENELEAFKSQVKEVLEGRDASAAEVMAYVELAVEACVEITGSGPEGTAMFLAAVAAAPILAAEYVGERPEVH